MLNQSLIKVEKALKQLRAGNMIILVDDAQRENEADIIFPAQQITATEINFMIQHGSGIICLATTRNHLKQIAVPLMLSPQENSNHFDTAFTISIEASHGVTTGVSAADRAQTIRVAAAANARPEDVKKPGHIFPLQAKEGGVLERRGHTEGAVDLMKIANHHPSAAICELMNRDGTMMQGDAVVRFAKKHQLTLLSVQDIIHYRLFHENMIAETATTKLPIADLGTFDLTVIKEKYTDKEHLVLEKVASSSQPPLVRIHSSCFTGETLGSMRCDCFHQFHYSLEQINNEGGLMIYLNQEGRNIGLFNKIKAYALQDNGMDTVEANLHLGLPVDAREYHIAAHVLKIRQLDNIRLLTNNPKKITSLKHYGITQIKRTAMPVFSNTHNHHYLSTKRVKLNHLIEENFYANIA